MTYSKTTWQDSVTPLSAANLNKMETGIETAQAAAEAAASSYTAADVLAKLLTVDGAGSGLDSDKFDGRDSTDFSLDRGNTATDWNTMTTPGIYRQGSADWTGYTNAPTSASAFGTLQVCTAGSSVTQIYYSHSTQFVWVRTKWNAADWNVWTSLITNNGGQTIGGAFTVTGVLNANGGITTSQPSVNFLEAGGIAADIKIGSVIATNDYNDASPAVGYVAAKNGFYWVGGGTFEAHTRLNGGVLEFWNGGAWQPVGLKAVQRGTVSPPVGPPYYSDITITAVNMAKTWVNVGGLNLWALTNVNYTFYAELINSTTLRIGSSTAYGGSPFAFRWELIESY